MKKFTQAEFDAMPIDEFGYKICPTGDYTYVNVNGVRCKFAEGCKFARGCKFAEGCEFAEGCKFAIGCEFGDSFYFKEKKFTKLFMMQNLDGSGRQIICLFGDDGTHVSAGCFFGTVDEFYQKAQSENKIFYANVVKAACDAYVATLNQHKGE